MKRASYLLIAIAFVITSCQTKMGTAMAYKEDEKIVSSEEKAWRGSYSGTIITEECGATTITVNLLQDMNYTLVKQCPGSRAMKQTGKYLVDKHSNVLILTRGNGGEIARFTIEGSNSLAQIDHNGNRLQSSITDQYVLRR